MPPDEDPQEDDLPDLRADNLEDDQTLAEMVDKAILGLSQVMPELRRLGDEILLQQETLRDAFPDAWPQCLSVDELVTARTAELAVELVRWSFFQGMRHGCRHGGEL